MSVARLRSSALDLDDDDDCEEDGMGRRVGGGHDGLISSLSAVLWVKILGLTHEMGNRRKGQARKIIRFTRRRDATSVVKLGASVS
jgi:hypothetical protein